MTKVKSTKRYVWILGQVQDHTTWLRTLAAVRESWCGYITLFGFGVAWLRK